MRSNLNAVRGSIALWVGCLNLSGCQPEQELAEEPSAGVGQIAKDAAGDFTTEYRRVGVYPCDITWSSQKWTVTRQ